MSENNFKQQKHSQSEHTPSCKCAFLNPQLAPTNLPNLDFPSVKKPEAKEAKARASHESLGCHCLALECSIRGRHSVAHKSLEEFLRLVPTPYVARTRPDASVKRCEKAYDEKVRVRKGANGPEYSKSSKTLLLRNCLG